MRRGGAGVTRVERLTGPPGGVGPGPGVFGRRLALARARGLRGGAGGAGALALTRSRRAGVSAHPEMIICCNDGSQLDRV